MLIQLNSKYDTNYHYGLNYGLVDILRVMSSHRHDNVIGRQWLICDIDFYAYCDDFSSERMCLLFPEYSDRECLNKVLVEGERLIERAALIHIFERLLLFRVRDPELPIEVDYEYKLRNGPMIFQATNVDLEIRSAESPFEVITQDTELMEHLQHTFSTSNRV